MKQPTIIDRYINALDIISRIDVGPVYYLVQNLAIEEDPECPTVYIQKRPSGDTVIRYNKDFIDKYAPTSEAFAGIILHEILHAMLGILSPTDIIVDRYLWNVALDIVVQSMIRSLITPSNYKLLDPFRNYYPTDNFLVLLRPLAVRESAAKKEYNKIPTELRGYYSRAYPNYRRDKSQFITTAFTSISERDWYDILCKLLSKSSSSSSTSLIGSDSLEHDLGYGSGSGSSKDSESVDGDQGGKDSDKDGENKKISIGGEYSHDDSPFSLDILSEAINNSDIKGSRYYSYGPGGVINRYLISALKRKSAEFNNAVFLASLQSARNDVVSSFSIARSPARSVRFPSAVAGSDLLKMSAGYYPVFFKSSVAKPQNLKCVAYIDVSGSVTSIIDWVYGCLIDISSMYHVIPVLFSTEVKEVTLDDIKSGRVYSTYGTSFNCVLSDALTRRESKFLIFTDGFASIDPNLVKELKEQNKSFVCALTSDGNTSTVNRFCSKVVKLPYNLS